MKDSELGIQFRTVSVSPVSLMKTISSNVDLILGII